MTAFATKGSIIIYGSRTLLSSEIMDEMNGYKETDIGSIPAEWDVVSLGDVCEVDWGNTSLTKELYRPSGYPAFSATGQDGFLDFYEHEGNAVILSAIGARSGKCFFASGKWTAIKNTIVIKSSNDQRTDTGFVYYYINDESYWSRRGSGQPFIAIGSAKRELLPLPPLPEQRTIAAILSKIQQAIETQEKIIERTRELKKSLMAKLFTEGLHGEELKETEIGLMPKSWEVATIGSIAVDGVKNGAFIKNPRWGKGIPFLNVVDTYRREIVNIDSLMRLEASQAVIDNYTLANNDILFVRSSLKEEGVGQACLVENLPEPTIYYCHLMKLSPKLDVVDPLYLVLYCLTDQGKRDLIAKSNKTTMTTINQNGLLSFQFPLAPIEEQRAISNVARRINDKLALLEAKLAQRKEIFRTMLHQLMTGRIRVNNIELSAP